MEGIFLALLGYGVFINIGALLLMGQDKSLSRKKDQGSRTSEGLLFLAAILGGALGVYAGMFIFRHKTKKVSFLLGIPILFFQQLLLLNLYFFSN